MVASTRAYWLWIASLAALGLFLRGSAIDAGFYADDFDHHAMLDGYYPVERGPLDLFNFGDGSARDNSRLIGEGHFPWWSNPRLRLSMLRPLSSALIAMDHGLFGLWGPGHHLHSMLWWVLLLCGAAALFRRVLPPTVALVASGLFALEEGHVLPFAWLANRSALVATALAIWAVWAHLRSRDSVVWARPVSILLTALSLLAGEYALSALILLPMYERFGDPPGGRRYRTLWPHAALVLAYLAARQGLGYGTVGSGFYVSPAADPLGYLSIAFVRIPVLAGELLYGITADWFTVGTPWRRELLKLDLFSPELWMRLPDWRTWQLAIGWSAVCLLGFALWRGARGGARWPGRWLLFATLPCLLMVVGSIPTARLTIAAALGVDAALATLLIHALVRARAGSWGGRLIVGVVVAIHGLGAAHRSHHEVDFHTHRAEMERRWVLEADIDDARVAEQRILVIGAEDLTTAFYLPEVRHMYGRPLPRAYWVLSGAQHAHDVKRVSDRVLEVTVLGSDLDRTVVGSNYRPADMPFVDGQRADIDGLHIEVLKTLRGQPMRMRFSFDDSLDDLTYVLLHSTQRGLRLQGFPRIGDTVRFKKPVYPNHDSLKAFAAESRVR